jgi:hypothetical protein
LVIACARFLAPGPAARRLALHENTSPRPKRLSTATSPQHNAGADFTTSPHQRPQKFWELAVQPVDPASCLVRCLNRGLKGQNQTNVGFPRHGPQPTMLQSLFRLFLSCGSRRAARFDAASRRSRSASLGVTGSAVSALFFARSPFRAPPFCARFLHVPRPGRPHRAKPLREVKVRQRPLRIAGACFGANSKSPRGSGAIIMTLRDG